LLSGYVISTERKGEFGILILVEPRKKKKPIEIKIKMHVIDSTRTKTKTKPNTDGLLATPLAAIFTVTVRRR